MRHNNQKNHVAPRKLRFVDEIGERYGEVKYRAGKVLRQWRTWFRCYIVRLISADEFLVLITVNGSGGSRGFP